MDYERNRSKQNDEPSVGIKFLIPKSETDRGAEESSTLERQFERKSGAVLRNQIIERGTESNHQLPLVRSNHNGGYSKRRYG
jgi:hypothetical protein